MRFLTYNVHGGIGRGGRSNAEKALALIETVDADVVALQEVQDDDEVGRSFLHRLRRLGYPLVVHGPTMRRHSGAYGNVLLSRFPAVERELIDLTQPGLEPRGAIRVRLRTPGGPTEVVATHLGLRAAERRRQAARLAEILGPRDAAAALRVGLGDFNEWLPWTRTLRRLSQALGAAGGRRTFPARFPLLALDRVFVHPVGALRELRALRGRDTLDVSDHLPLLAEITPPAAPGDAASPSA